MTDINEIRQSFAAMEGQASYTDAEFVARANQYMAPGMKLLNARCTEASRELGQIVITCDLDERFVNVVGFICGGYIAQMLDQAATGAGSLVSGKASPSLELKINFVAPAKPGRFTTIGSVVKTGRSISFLEARVFDESKTLIATGSVTAQLVSPATLAQKGASGG